MKVIFMPERNEESSYKDADFCKKLIQKNKDTIFFLIHKSVNTATEWNLAEGSQSAEVMNFFAFKDVVHQEDEGNQTLHWQPTNGTCTKTVHKFCSLPEIWVSKDYCVQLHLKHLIHYTVGISCILYPHIYTWHSKTARGFLFFLIDEYIRNCVLVICDIKFMNLYILFMWTFTGCNIKLLF